MGNFLSKGGLILKKIQSVLALSFFLTSLSFAGEKEDFQKIDALYKQKNFDVALEQSVNYIKNYPSSSRILTMRNQVGKLYFLKKDYKKAREQFREILKLEPSGSTKNETYYYLSRIYAALGEEEQNRFALTQIKESSSFYNKAYYESAIQYMEKGSYKEAIHLLGTPIQKKGDYYAESLLNMALAHFNREDFLTAKKYLLEYSSVEKNKNRSLVEYLYGTMLYKENKIEDATLRLEKLVQEDDRSLYGKKAVLTLIEIYSNRGNVAKVEYYLQKLQGQPEYNRAMTMIGDLYVSKEQYQKALEIYAKSNNQKDPRLLYGKAYSLYKLNRLEEALGYFENLRSTDYYNQAIYHIFAIEYKLKHYQKIIENREIMKRVVVTQTDNDNINTIIANAAYELGDYKLSKDYFGRLYAITPKKENLFRIILMDSKTMDLEDMSRRFADYQKYYPTDQNFKKEIYQAVGESYFKAGKTEEAIQVYQSYLSEKYDLDLTQALVTALLKEKRYTEMEQYLAKIPEGKANQYLRGIAAMGSGQHGEAERYFYQMLLQLPEGDSEIPKIQLNRVRNFFLMEKYPEVTKVGEAYLAKFSGKEKAEIVDKVALSYFRLGNFAKAREYNQILSKMEGFEEYGAFQIADSYYNEKKYGEAAKHFQAVAVNYPNGTYQEQARYWYANSLARQGDTKLFAEEKVKFLADYPDSSFANNLSSLDQNLKSDLATKNLEESLKNKKTGNAQQYVEQVQSPEDKSYYQARIYDKQGKKEQARKEYENLLQSAKYKDYANLQLGNYWYEKKDWKKAKAYYTSANSLGGAGNKDFVLYQLANIHKTEGREQEALKLYRVVYKGNGKYSVEAKTKAAEIYENMGDQKSYEFLYGELSKVKNKEVRQYALEKLLYFALEKSDMKKAKQYYQLLQKEDKKKAEKYQDFFR